MTSITNVLILNEDNGYYLLDDHTCSLIIDNYHIKNNYRKKRYQNISLLKENSMLTKVTSAVSTFFPCDTNNLKPCNEFTIIPTKRCMTTSDIEATADDVITEANCNNSSNLFNNSNNKMSNSDCNRSSQSTPLPITARSQNPLADPAIRRNTQYQIFHPIPSHPTELYPTFESKVVVKNYPRENKDNKDNRDNRVGLYGHASNIKSSCNYNNLGKSIRPETARVDHHPAYSTTQSESYQQSLLTTTCATSSTSLLSISRSNNSNLFIPQYEPEGRKLGSNENLGRIGWLLARRQQRIAAKGVEFEIRAAIDLKNSVKVSEGHTTAIATTPSCGSDIYNDYDNDNGNSEDVSTAPPF